MRHRIDPAFQQGSINRFPLEDMLPVILQGRSYRKGVCRDVALVGLDSSQRRVRRTRECTFQLPQDVLLLLLVAVSM